MDGSCHMSLVTKFLNHFKWKKCLIVRHCLSCQIFVYGWLWLINYQYQAFSHFFKLSTHTDFEWMPPFSLLIALHMHMEKIIHAVSFYQKECGPIFLTVAFNWEVKIHGHTHKTITRGDIFSQCSVEQMMQILSLNACHRHLMYCLVNLKLYCAPKANKACSV